MSKTVDAPADDPLAGLRAAYWRRNVAIMTVLLLVWAFVGLGCGVLWADWLNQWSLGGVPLGFWFAQQGSIFIFVGIIAFYVWYMLRLDKWFDEQDH